MSRVRCHRLSCAAGSPVSESIPDAVGGAPRNRIRRAKGAIASGEVQVVDHRPRRRPVYWS